MWFQGGDQIWLVTQGWLLGQLELPPDRDRLPVVVVVARSRGSPGGTFVQVLPPLVLFQVLVLGPVALLCFYGLAAHIGGRLLGYWAAFLWVIAPFASIPLFVDRYQERWAEHFLPQALGLTAMSDFPSLVLVLASALFLVRSLEGGRLPDAVLAGLLLGAAGGMKPPNLLMGIGAALAYLVARHWRAGLVFGAAVVPSVLVIALWKERGLGQLPVLSLEETRLAADAGVVALSVDLDKYIELDWDHFRTQMDQLREYFWSARARAVGAVRGPARGDPRPPRRDRGAPRRVARGVSPGQGLLDPCDDRLPLLLAPAPACLARLPAPVRLDPAPRPDIRTAPRRPAPHSPLAADRLAVDRSRRRAHRRRARHRDRRLVTDKGPELAVFQDDAGNFILTPVDHDVEVAVSATEAGREVSWTSGGPWRADVFYRVYRTDGPVEDVECEHTDGATSEYCFIRSIPIATTRETSFVDTAPPAGGATYRIGVATNWLDDPEQGDVFAFSPPALAND